VEENTRQAIHREIDRNSRMKIQSINPFTAEVMQEFDALTAEQCQELLARAASAFAGWKKRAVSERTLPLRQLAMRLRDNKDAYARLITMEMGKPIKQSLAEIEKCAWLCDHYAEHADRLLRPEVVEAGASKSYVAFEPMGIILGIMPWNFPFWQVFRFAVPAIMAGNCCLIKHASNVPQTAGEIEKLFAMSGFPPNVLSILLIDAQMALQLIEHDRIAAVSLTGSVPAGVQIGSEAGKRIKKIVLELGGSDPFIILDDADLDKAAKTAIQSRFTNTGQSCIAAKRVIVMESVADAFQEKFIGHFQALKVGDPMHSETDIGPLARREFVPNLRGYVEEAVAKGARAIYGPEPPAGKGFFFRPTVLLGVNDSMKVLREEVFGPIAPLIVARDETEIVSLANATEFGLGAAIWSRNIARAEELAREIEAGFVAINDMVKSDPRLPFGGVKKSGVGRELSHYGLKEFVNIKSIVIQE
jgi:succinate-semialdehyde dehydrogenase/glutarate-semialdehyde dehydrogenase